ncbi:MAG TPA: magnesium/cobalt efflux protein, partial [Gammaproteobacteria bacterium]|nr:magnesium/cobalt efflux protein [Gammaproteobacteria bacterium]
VATIIGFTLFGETGVLLAPWVLTFTFLIFAEVAPKTIAAERPENWAFKAVFGLEPLLKLFHPAVVAVNTFSNVLVRPFIRDSEGQSDQLSAEELRTVVSEGGHSVGERQAMLARILDLESVSVNDIMVPRN